MPDVALLLPSGLSDCGGELRSLPLWNDSLAAELGRYTAPTLQAMDAIITVWVITWRIVWPAMLATVGLPLVALLLQRRIELAPVAAFALPIVGPLLIVIWSGVFWAAEERASTSPHWASWILTALVLPSVVLVIGVAVRYRRAPRYWAVILGAVASGVFALAAGFIGSMAISNTWL